MATRKARSHSEESIKFVTEVIKETDMNKKYLDTTPGTAIKRGLADIDVIGYVIGSISVVLGAICLWLVWERKDAIIEYAVDMWKCESCLELSVAHVLLVLFAAWFFFRRERSVYLMDFALFTPDEGARVPTDRFLKLQAKIKSFSEESLAFMKRLSERTGLGENTYFPSGVLHDPMPDFSLASSRQEAETVLFSCVGDLLEKTKVNPKEIDVLVVNCSMFCPTPSLSSMLVNKFKFRSDIKTYNLGGMGCSASIISIQLAADMLRVKGRGRAIVVSMESITNNWYLGNDKSMLISNTLFRLGGAAMLLSSRWWDRFGAIFKLLHVVRTHKGADDLCYSAVYAKEDEQGLFGVSLSKKLMDVAGMALRSNITTLGPRILPITEQARFVINLVLRKFFKKDIRPYMPNFKKAVDHFCIHAGGRAVIDALEKTLQLTPDDVKPSRYVLHRWGNTSSSSIWYELQYIRNRGIKSGQKVWQIAFGSGFKCNSAVWKALKSTPPDSRYDSRYKQE